MQNQEFRIGSEVMASQGERFINYVVDFIVQYFLAFVFGLTATLLSKLTGNSVFSDWLITMNKVQEYLFGIIIALFYYSISEIYFSRTIGKLFTKTIVVMEDGSKPDTMTIIRRTLCRIIPFDGLSFLGSQSRGWHDSIPNVYVVKMAAFNESKELFEAFDEIGEPSL